MTHRSAGLFLVAVWVLFCAYTFYEAQYPGFEPLARWRHPWDGAAITCAVLAVLIGMLYGIIRIPPGKWRIVAIVAYTVALLFFIWTQFITDQRGHFYVPGRFATIALLGLIVWGVAAWLRGRRLAANKTGP